MNEQYVYPPPEPRATARERAHERLRIAAENMHASLAVLEGWEDDFGSQSVTEAVWRARDALRDALDSLPFPGAAVADGDER